MLYYLKKYPLSLVVILAVVYLSFFRPPSTELSKIPHIDKVVHVCMYLGMSGMLWLEYWRAHLRTRAPRWHGWVGACVCPILFSGLVERLDGLCRQYHRRPAGHAGLPPVASAVGQVCTTPQVLMPSQEPLRPLVPVLCRGLFILWILYLFYRYSTTELSFTPFEPFIRMVFPEGWSALSFSMRACTSG